MLACAFVAACTVSTTPGGNPGDAATQAEGGTPPPNRPPPADELAPGPIITPQAPNKPTDGSVEAGNPGLDASSDNDGSVPTDAQATCGNGKLEASETCDPGKDACCNATCSGPRRVGVTCRASAGVCDLEEVCDGTGVACPSDAMQMLGHVCRTASDACDVAEICNGTSATCPNDAVAPNTFKCANAGGAECDADDFCDGIAKSCPDLVKPNTATCGGAPSGACDAQDHCAGVGTTCTPEFASSSTTCGSSVDTECDNPDTCDGAGNCQVNNEPDTTNCGDQGVVCHNDDKCDGAGACTDNGVVGMGTTCGSSSDTVCDNPDTCDASGTCQPNYEPLHASCGDTGVDCYVNDECDGNGTCTNKGLEPMGTPCGSSSNTACDNPDTCDASGTCLPNHELPTVGCGDQGVDCRVDDKCDGNGACEDKGFATEFTPCGTATPEDVQCDNPDSCDAVGVCQPRNEPTTTNCGDQGVECHADDKCKGDGTCEDKGFLGPGTACGSGGSSACDSPDSCDAIGFCQPQPVQDGDPCGDQGIDCNFDDMCMGGLCMDAGFWTLDTACGSNNDDACDNPDKCDATGACLVNHEPVDTNCGDQGVDCHNDDKCDGSGACEDKGVVAMNTDCGSSSDTQCDNPDKCDASGLCLTNHEPSLAPCGDQGVACTFDDACDGNGACSDAGFHSPGAPCGSGADTECDNADTCNGAGTCQPNHEPMTTSCGVLGVDCLIDDKCDGVGACADLGVKTMGSSCGSPSDTDCDNPDTCNASGGCVANLEPPATQCPDGSPSNCQDAQCDGAGACDQAGGLEFEFTACGSATSDDCDNADSCDTLGTCQPRPKATGTQCTDTNLADCQDAQCNGSGTCNQTMALEVTGTACGNPLDDDCTNPDTCDVTGTCLFNHAAATTQCTDTNTADCLDAQCDGTGTCDQAYDNEANMTPCGDPSSSACDNADRCNGAGTCQARHVGAGTACGSATNTDCDNPDTCDGLGACAINNEAAGFACTDTTPGDCKDARCDGAASCNQTYTNENSGYGCGNSMMTPCTFADTCDAGGNCQVNDAPDGTICRAGTGTCNPQETCSSGLCPVDAFASGGTPCGSPTDDTCTDPDSCDGTGSCLPNNASNATVCRVDAGECDLQETCSSGVCPVDLFEIQGTPCGSSSSAACDAPDSCNATGTCIDRVDPNTTVCRVDAGACDVEDKCDGTSKPCPADAFEPSGTMCGSSSATVCDNPDTCNGSGGCQSNPEPGTTVCRPVAGECDLAENCDGAGACPGDVFKPEKTPCTDATPSNCKVAQCNLVGMCDQNYANKLPGAQCDDTNLSDCADAQCNLFGTCDQAAANEAQGTACGDLADCVQEKCNADATCVNTEAPESDGYACYVGGVAPPDPTNGRCSTGTCCPGATTNQGPTTCGFPGEDNVVFVTSQAVLPGTLGGIPGARQFCQTLAQGANMGGTWRPWLGDSFFDVFVDLSDGPYRDVRGRLIAPSKPALLGTPSVPLQVPIEIMEMNLVSVPPVAVATNLSPDGRLTDLMNNCMNWTAPIGVTTGGLSSASDPGWTTGFTLTCGGPAHLYCFEDDCPGIPEVDFQNDPYNCGGCGNVCNDGGGTCAFGRCAGRVFVTSTPYKGNLGGLGGADTICDMHAQAANLPGSYSAWLSQVDQSGMPTHAYNRVLDQPYYLVDGSPVAGSVAHLRNADTMPLANAIQLDENGVPSAATEAWTGSLGDGSSAPGPWGDCQEWSSSLGTEYSVKGDPQSTSDTWSYDVGAGYSCDIARPLYCFQVLGR